MCLMDPMIHRVLWVPMVPTGSMFSKFPVVPMEGLISSIGVYGFNGSNGSYLNGAKVHHAMHHELVNYVNRKVPGIQLVSIVYSLYPWYTACIPGIQLVSLV